MAKRILVDINVCLDVLLDRKPFVEHSGQIFEMAEQKEITLLLSGISVDTLFYVMRPAMGAAKATDTLKTLLDLMEIAEVNDSIVRGALQAGWNDLEDALQFFAAKHARSTHLITRNPADFKKADSDPVVQTPQQFLDSLES